jgi:hypothetical protein
MKVSAISDWELSAIFTSQWHSKEDPSTIDTKFKDAKFTIANTWERIWHQIHFDDL